MFIHANEGFSFEARNAEESELRAFAQVVIYATYACISWKNSISFVFKSLNFVNHILGSECISWKNYALIGTV